MLFYAASPRAAGREAYTRIAQKWAAIHAAEIGQPGQELSWKPLRCTSTGPDEVLVSWEATWIPQPMLPLVRFGRCVCAL